MKKAIDLVNYLIEQGATREEALELVLLEFENQLNKIQLATGTDIDISGIELDITKIEDITEIEFEDTSFKFDEMDGAGCMNEKTIDLY